MIPGCWSQNFSKSECNVIYLFSLYSAPKAWIPTSMFSSLRCHLYIVNLNWKRSERVKHWLIPNKIFRWCHSADSLIWWPGIRYQLRQLCTVKINEAKYNHFSAESDSPCIQLPATVPVNTGAVRMIKSLWEESWSVGLSTELAALAAASSWFKIILIHQSMDCIL